MPTTDTKVDQSWREAGEAWSHAAVDWAFRFEPHARDAIEAALSLLAVGPGTDLVDVACGAGYALGRAARLGARTAGIDASAGLIDIARRRAPDAELVTGTMFSLPWPAQSFDVATSFNGIWGGCDDALRELDRVLRPGGGVALTFWGPGRGLDLRDYFIALGTTAPGGAEELKGLAAIGEPGVAESMLGAAGFVRCRRYATVAVLELTDADEAWRCLRSPGIAVPSLITVGERELRSRVLAAIADRRAPDGSYRLVNEVTLVIAYKPAAVAR